MMFRLALIVVAAAAVTAQAPRTAKYSDNPQFASILNEQRYLSGDGTFGAAYQQEDGIDFKEESDAEGNRKGSYSYIDPTGERRTVTYTAGKNGFQATGDHLPVAPAPIQEPQPQYNQQPQQRYNPQPQYNSVAPRQNNPAEDDGQYRPELYETDYVSAPQPNRNQIVAGSPFKQPYQQPQYSGVQQPQPQPQYSGVQQPQPQQQYTSFNPPPAARQNYFPVDQTTPAPHRFFPPGQFDLNRSPDGFTYTFRKA